MLCEMVHVPRNSTIIPYFQIRKLMLLKFTCIETGLCFRISKNTGEFGVLHIWRAFIHFQSGYSWGDLIYISYYYWTRYDLCLILGRVRYERKRSRSRSVSRGPVRRRRSRSPVRSPSPANNRRVISDVLKSRLGPKTDDHTVRVRGRSISRSRSRSSSRSRSPDVATRKHSRKVSSPSRSNSRSSSPGAQRGLVSYEDLSPSKG